MNQLVNAFLSLIVLTAVFAANINLVHAQYIVASPTPGISYLSVNKLVRHPHTQHYVDNLTAADYQFLPNQEVVYRLTVNNTGQTVLNNVSLIDKLPAQLDFVSGPGSFDQNTRTLNITVDRLSVGESKSYDVIAKVRGDVLVNACPINIVEARSNELFSQDSSMICLQTKVLGSVIELPVTGPSQVLTVFGTSLLLLSFAAFMFRRSLVK